MMKWTDRHCRYFHRRLTRKALLYTEMVAADAVLRGNAKQLLGFSKDEHPVALQIGGSDPEVLGRAVARAREFGFDEFNLNAGCPSDRVQAGRFGAVLMKTPALAGECVRAMIENAEGVEVTVKCRLGVDDQDPRETLPAFIEQVALAGTERVILHARKAWLKGLNPKENRTVPPLDRKMALTIKQHFPELDIVLNGGITSLEEAQECLSMGFDGVMIGRAAYQTPFDLLAPVDSQIFCGQQTNKSRIEVARAMLPYISRMTSRGIRLHRITRHMLGLFAGQRGARMWRRTLSGLSGTAATHEAFYAAMETFFNNAKQAGFTPVPAC